MASDSGSKKRRIMIVTADESIIEQIQNNTNGALFKTFMLDAGSHELEVSHSNLNLNRVQQPPSKAKKIKSSPLTCVVCASPAHGYNFGAITCESCKAFFRRNAYKNAATLVCRHAAKCDVTIDSRRRCSACRLTKCLESGMQRDRLLTDEQKADKRRKIEENRTLACQASTETRAASTIDVVPPQPIKEAPKLLSEEDSQKVAMIEQCYEKRIELAARAGLPWDPSSRQHNLSQHINRSSVTVLRLLSFFKQIPEFNQLSVDDRVTLVKYNLVPIMLINTSLFYEIGNDEMIESESDAPWSTAIVKEIHGQKVYTRVMEILDSFVRVARSDRRIIQFILIILVLTPGFLTNEGTSEPMLSDAAAVHRAQTYHTELLWRYLEATQGRLTAIKIFNELITHFITWQSLANQLQQVLYRILSPIELNDLLPLMKSLLHIP